MPGPPPQPIERKRRLGNPGKQKLPALDAVGAVEALPTAAPDHLGPDGQALWDHVVQGAVWLAETDRPLLVMLCEKADRRAMFVRLLADSAPVLFTDKDYAYPNPLVGMISTIETEINKIYASMGLTPADRTRMGLVEVKAKNAFEEMLAKRANRE